MTLKVEDRLAIHELLSLHGHLFDNGKFDRLGELFTEDILYDVTALGFGTLRGIEALREASLTLGDGNPLGHHVTNVIVEGQRPRVARVL